MKECDAYFPQLPQDFHSMFLVIFLLGEIDFDESSRKDTVMNKPPVSHFSKVLFDVLKPLLIKANTGTGFAHEYRKGIHNRLWIIRFWERKLLTHMIILPLILILSTTKHGLASL